MQVWCKCVSRLYRLWVRRGEERRDGHLPPAFPTDYPEDYESVGQRFRTVLFLYLSLGRIPTLMLDVNVVSQSYYIVDEYV